MKKDLQTLILKQEQKQNGHYYMFDMENTKLILFVPDVDRQMWTVGQYSQKWN